MGMWNKATSKAQIPRNASSASNRIGPMVAFPGMAQFLPGNRIGYLLEQKRGHPQGH